MSAQGTIVILLSIIGFLTVSWIGVAAMWVKDRLANHEDRLNSLEDLNEKTFSQNSEILDVLKEMRDVG